MDFRVACASDFHFPIASKKAVNWFLEKASDFEADVIVLNGDIIEGKAASRHARDERHSWTTKDELEGAYGLLKSINERFPDAYKVLIYGNHDCFDDQTDVLTKRGWVRFDELSYSDKVASVNVGTGRVQYAPPKAIIRKRYTGKLAYASTLGADIAVTPTHRMVYRTAHNPNWRVGTAEDLFNRAAQFDIPTSAFYEGDWVATPTDDEVRLAAWILTDGSYNSQNQVNIYQRPETVDLIKQILDRCGIEYSEYVRHRKIKEVCGRTLVKEPKAQHAIYIGAAYTARVKSLLPSKRDLPDWVWSLDEHQSGVFLDSLCDGDGTRNKEGSGFVLYGTREFLEQVQHFCVVKGYRASLKEYRIGDWKLKICDQGASTVLTPKKKVDWKEYDGYVYCATTEDSTLIVRRNGKCHVSGNCNILNYNAGRLPKEIHEIIRFYSEDKLRPALEDWRVIDHYRHDSAWYLGQLCFRHGCDASKASIAKDIADYCPYHGLHVSGHTHRPVQVTQHVHGDVRYPFYHANTGCMMDISKAHYMDRLRLSNWGQGLLLAEVSAPGFTEGRKDYAKPRWKAKVEILDIGSHNYFDVAL